MRMNFYDLWQQYDVIGNNQVEVEQMASFMKKLLHDPTIQIQWALNYYNKLFKSRHYSL